MLDVLSIKYSFETDMNSIYSYLLIATLLQAVWSLLAGIVDIYALSVRRSLHHWLLISLFTVGDGVSDES